MSLSGESWTATIDITVHGVWDPADAAACAELISAVNRLRSLDNEKPCIRRGWWSNAAEPWLDVKIGRTSMRLDAGDHLVSVVMPDGSTEWSAVDAEDLARMRPRLGPLMCPTCLGRGGSCGTCRGSGQTWPYVAKLYTPPAAFGPSA